MLQLSNVIKVTMFLLLIIVITYTLYSDSKVVEGLDPIYDGNMVSDPPMANDSTANDSTANDSTANDSTANDSTANDSTANDSTTSTDTDYTPAMADVQYVTKPMIYDNASQNNVCITTEGITVKSCPSDPSCVDVSFGKNCPFLDASNNVQRCESVYEYMFWGETDESPESCQSDPAKSGPAKSDPHKSGNTQPSTSNPNTIKGVILNFLDFLNNNIEDSSVPNGVGSTLSGPDPILSGPDPTLAQDNIVPATSPNKKYSTELKEHNAKKNALCGVDPEIFNSTKGSPKPFNSLYSLY